MRVMPASAGTSARIRPPAADEHRPVAVPTGEGLGLGPGLLTDELPGPAGLDRGTAVPADLVSRRVAGDRGDDRDRCHDRQG
jgi:hypothetical protein